MTRTFTQLHAYLTARQHPAIPDVDAYVKRVVSESAARAEDRIFDGHPAAFWKGRRSGSIVGAADCEYDVTTGRECRP